MFGSFENFFADDCALVASSPDDIQNIVTHFSGSCRHFGLNISLGKTGHVPTTTITPELCCAPIIIGDH